MKTRRCWAVALSLVLFVSVAGHPVRACSDCDTGDDGCLHCVTLSGPPGPEGYENCAASCNYCRAWNACFWI
jgi:hypothetical protein